MLIAEYRPLFTQPFNLRRYEADSARQAAAEAQRAEAAASTVASTPMSSPLLTPIRCERLSVMQPEGASPFSDCCGTPLPASPVSLCLAAAMDASGGDTLGASPPFSPMVASPRQRPAPGFAAFQQHPGAAAADVGADDEEHYHLEQAFSSMLDATVSGMLFDLPLPGDGGDGGDCGGLEHPGSPVAVVRDLNSDGGDTDGSGGQGGLAGRVGLGREAWRPTPSPANCGSGGPGKPHLQLPTACTAAFLCAACRRPF